MLLDQNVNVFDGDLFLFEDKNKNGLYDIGEKPLADVVVVLDDKMKAASGRIGTYMLRNIPEGEHTLKLDLQSIPVQYIPKVPVIKKIKVNAGTLFVYNIPLEVQLSGKKK